MRIVSEATDQMAHSGMSLVGRFARACGLAGSGRTNSGQVMLGILLTAGQLRHLAQELEQ